MKSKILADFQIGISIRIAIAPFQFSYRIDLLFPSERIFFRHDFHNEEGLERSNFFEGTLPPELVIAPFAECYYKQVLLIFNNTLGHSFKNCILYSLLL